MEFPCINTIKHRAEQYWMCPYFPIFPKGDIENTLGRRFEIRKTFVNSILKKANETQLINDTILIRSQEIEELNIKGLDALHPACAERLRADYLEIKDRLFGEKSAAYIYAEMSEWEKAKGKISDFRLKEISKNREYGTILRTIL